MRLFLAALTVGAAGVGLVYLQQSSLPTAEASSKVERHLFDWQSADDTLKVVNSDVTTHLDEPPLIVRDTINSTRAEITSVLDEFVRVNGESSGVPSPSDIVTQADATSPVVDDGELIPFATSDGPPVETSDLAAGDAVSSLTPTDPEVEAGRDTADSPSRPAINEATLVTQKPAAKKEPVQPNRQPDVAAKSPSKTELLPGRKLPDTSAPVADSDWQIVGRSTNNVPLHTRRFGQQGTRSLVIAGMDGKDLISTRWNDELVETLVTQKGLFQSNEVMVFRAANPDGLIKKSSTNAQGVLINRNFPSRRYQFLTDKSAGSGPSSEAETKAILQVLYTFRPRRIIHLSSTNGRSVIYYNRASKDLAASLQKQYSLDARPLDVELMPGSLEDFADGTLDAAVVSLKLNTGPDWRQAWSQHRPMVLSAISGQNADKMLSVSEELVNAAPDSESSRIPDLNVEPARVKNRRGYEELPPPPQ
ncbi:MAG: hypothetical protein JSS49_14035 [Planctomycetes bacterium]|nr:hypothetical protein [Planctomycetota bacterium]